MFARILVPLDGSEFGELALRYAEELAGAFGAELTLLLVCEPAEAKYRHMSQLYLDKVAAEAKARINASPSGAQVKAVISDGVAATEITDFANKNDTNLVIMVSHGRSGMKSWSIGSTATEVIQRASQPVLLVRAGAPIARANNEKVLRQILVALDGSEISEATLPYIREFASKLELKVILLRVVPTGEHVHTVGGLDYILFPEQLVEKMKTEAQQYLEATGALFKETKAEVGYEVREGNAAEEIIRMADQNCSSLVAMSSHGRSGIKRWIFGSVTHKVLHGGSRPILLVKARG